MTGIGMSMGGGGSSTSSMHRGLLSVGGISVGGGGHGATNILPTWLALIWMLVFIAVLVIHARHLLGTGGQRRVWHGGHVLMALGMAFMYAPSSIDRFDIPAAFWQLAFADGALAVVAWIAYEAFARRAINMLWLVMALDLGAMAYMWSPGGFQTPLTWLLVAYLVAQSLLWGTDRMRSVDHMTLWGGGMSLSGGGQVAISAAQPLICFRDLRLSMSAMTLGMAYMFAAMQLLI